MKRNGPGCTCCEPPCSEYDCGDGTTENITATEWVVTLPDEITFWFEYLNFPLGLPYKDFIKAVTTGWSAFNGTYTSTRNLTTCEWSVPTETNTISYEYAAYRTDAISRLDPGCPTTTYALPSVAVTGSQDISVLYLPFGFGLILGNLTFTNWFNQQKSATIGFTPASICTPEVITWTAPEFYDPSTSLICTLVDPADTATATYTPTIT